MNKAVRYRINYKFECNEGSRVGQRSYHQYDRIIEYLGEVDQFEFSLKKGVLVDLKNTKDINERKMLY